jgi:crotonobetainyl-CoA:carnitine CoA-transferase CaiB-like acyl-CoA transferase
MDAVPGVGEHTDGILHELGLDPAGIEALRKSSAI